MNTRFPFNPPTTEIPNNLAAVTANGGPRMLDDEIWSESRIWKRVQVVQRWTVVFAVVFLCLVLGPLSSMDISTKNALLVILAAWMLYVLIYGRRLANATIESRIVVEWTNAMLATIGVSGSSMVVQMPARRSVRYLSRLTRWELSYAGAKFLIPASKRFRASTIANHLRYLAIEADFAELKCELDIGATDVHRKDWSALEQLSSDSARPSLAQRILDRAVAMAISLLATLILLNGFRIGAIEWVGIAIGLFFAALMAWVTGPIRTPQALAQVIETFHSRPRLASKDRPGQPTQPDNHCRNDETGKDEVNDSGPSIPE